MASEAPYRGCQPAVLQALLPCRSAPRTRTAPQRSTPARPRTRSPHTPSRPACCRAQHPCPVTIQPPLYCDTILAPVLKPLLSRYKSCIVTQPTSPLPFPGHDTKLYCDPTPFKPTSFTAIHFYVLQYNFSNQLPAIQYLYCNQPFQTCCNTLP